MPTPASSTKIQITRNALEVPRVVLGSNRDGQEVYLYFDPELERVVISGALGLAYEKTDASGSSRIYVLDTEPDSI